jgi:hypothetical protein
MRKVIILKMCDNTCPRLVIDGKRAVLRDDYNKKGFRVGKLLKTLGKV